MLPLCCTPRNQGAECWRSPCSGIASLDATVVNIALPAIGRDFDTGITALQRLMNGYTLTLAAFLLIGGSLGDRFGRRKVYLTGIVWCALASVTCGLAQPERPSPP
jgi:MFS family permease